MKKLFALLAVAFGVMSCQTDVNDFGANVGGEQEVNITVALPEATRANSAVGAFENGVLSTHDLRYILEIYYGETCHRQVNYTTENSTSFPVRLAPGREYKIAVWADFVEKGTTAEDADLYYETSAGLANISIIDGAPMTEARDAFCGRYTLTSDKSVASIPTINLTRPFAKVRVVTTDVEDLAKIGVALPTSATITYANDVIVYNKFNALTGDVASDNAVKVYENFNIEDIYNDATGEMTLFADYLFVPQNGSITKFTLNVTDHVNKAFTTDIPVVANKLTTIKGDILTNGSDITVEIKDSFAGEDSFVQNVNAAQSAIDNAIANTTIYLEPGVDYGTLLIRPVAGAANTITDCDYLVYRNEMLRKVENLTIIGAPGATVDAIKVVAGYIEGSTGYVVDIENLVIDSVEFTDKHTNAPHSYAAPIFIDLTYTNVDGLTVKNCKLEGNNDKMNFVYVYGSGNPSNSTFATAAKNIVLENNYVDGIARLCELRQTENVTITNNTIKNTALHAMLLPVDNGTYSGNVTITDNYAEGINERFVRMAGAGDAVVVIKDNYIANYLGEDADYIKVTDGTNVTIENNTVAAVVEDTENLAESIEDGFTSINLAAGEYNIPSTLDNSHDSLTIVGAGIDNTTVNGTANSNNNSPGNYAHGLDLVFENLTFVTPNNGYNGGFGHAKSVTFRNCKIVGQYYAHSGAPHYFYDCTIDPLTGYLYTYASDCLFEGCTFSASEGKALQIYEDAATGENTVTITNCTFVAAKQATTWDGKPVTGIDVNSYGAKFTVYINNCTTSGFPTGLNSYSDLWNVKDGGKAHANVYVDGALVWKAGSIANGVILNDEGEYLISTAAGMFWFANEVNVNNKDFSGKTVKLTENINLDNAAWTPIGQTGATQFKGTFDGNSKTISNLNIDATAQTGANYSSGLFGWLNAAKVKNVTINGAVVKGNHNVGVIAGYLETSGCTIEACNITDAVVEGHHATNDACGDKVGGIVGHAGNSGVVVKDCVISSSTISAGRDAGQVAGAAKTDNVIGCSANNVTVTANGECTGANVRNEVIGRVL